MTLIICSVILSCKYEWAEMNILNTIIRKSLNFENFNLPIKFLFQCDYDPRECGLREFYNFFIYSICVEIESISDLIGKNCIQQFKMFRCLYIKQYKIVTRRQTAEYRILKFRMWRGLEIWDFLKIGHLCAL